MSVRFQVFGPTGKRSLSAEAQSADKLIKIFLSDSGPACATTERVENVTISLNFENPVKRTSVTVPNNGYAIVRFKANNPGTGIY